MLLRHEWRGRGTADSDPTRRVCKLWVNLAHLTVHRLVTNGGVDNRELVDNFETMQATELDCGELSTKTVDRPVDIVDNFAN